MVGGCFVKHIIWKLRTAKLITTIIVSLLFELRTKYEVVIILFVRVINVINLQTTSIRYAFVLTETLTFMIGACKHTIIEQTLNISIN